MRPIQNELDPLLDALRTGRFDDYVAQATAFEKAHSTNALWAALGEVHGSAFDLFERLQAWPSDGIRTAMRRLMPAVEHVHLLSASDGARLLEFAGRVPQSFRHSVAELLRPHMTRSPELGEQLGELLRHGSLKGEGSTWIWADAFAAGAPAGAGQYALRLSAGSVDDVALMSVLLQFLPTANEDVQAAIVPAEADLACALTGMVPTPSDDAWLALTVIADVSATAMKALQQAIEAGNASAIVAMARWLHRLTGLTVGATAIPVENLLALLLQHAIQEAEVRSAVDSAIAGMLYRSSLRPVALQCLGVLRVVEADLDELFPETISGVCEQPEDFTRLLTEWLVAEGVAFAAVRSLLACCIQQRVQVSLDSVVFGLASVPRKVVAARRLLALTHNGPVLCRFIACLAEEPALQPDGLNMAAQMLNEAFAEYPNATEEFLRARTRAARRDAPFAAVYRGSYANVLRWRLVLRRLPRLNELRPTDAQLHALRAMRQRVNREIMRGAHEKSVFASIFTQVNLAQGRRFATHTEHGAPQVAEMQQASHSIELPSSELADPVGGMLRRARTLVASR
jgi:hypothetical protein